MNTFNRYLLMSVSFLICFGCSGDNPISDSEPSVDANPTNVTEESEETKTESVCTECTENECECTESKCECVENKCECPDEEKPVTSTDSDDYESDLETESESFAFAGVDPDTFVNGLRVWRDSENLFTTNAELVAVGLKDRQVRLLKENGVAVTVPYDRLSEFDQKYVNEFLFLQSQRSQNSTPSIEEILVK